MSEVNQKLFGSMCFARRDSSRSRALEDLSPWELPEVEVGAATKFMQARDATAVLLEADVRRETVVEHGEAAAQTKHGAHHWRQFGLDPVAVAR